ncbi:protein phosphatase 2C, putative [Entamoeba dispar SAW760]|uniref:Protein phosphatase 2C, putative n=1 Tax=Entamoeba dispar (strain ATCC PRA-260 / SAW760) TaxID=370354 RepID=B0EIU6_ENTDS|nr:protein phosphatase 2C, putative [Entamoeba dispar SAW760]EDR25548.1 protein phosphatase 2C, putative [Entamoeba dispar SAW760]|eukprot:EDR25548.1 protein phosphatase 2C, putative [Entamoeba dispar SAW760]
MTEENKTKSFEFFIGKQKTLIVNFQLTKKEGSLLDSLLIKASLIDKNEPENQNGNIYTTTMKVFSHKDGLETLTHIINVNEVNDGYQIQFDYGGLVMDTVVRKPFVAGTKTITEIKPTNINDEKFNLLEQKVIELSTTCKQLESLKEDHKILIEKMSSIEEKSEKTRLILKGNEELLGIDAIQLAFTRFMSTGNVMLPIIPRVVTVSPKYLEISTSILTEHGEFAAIVLIKNDDENDISLKLLTEDGIYIIWFSNIQFNEIISICTKLQFKQENNNVSVGVPLEHETKWFIMAKTSFGLEVMNCVIRTYQFIGALIATEIPVSAYICSDITLCEKKMPLPPIESNESSSEQESEEIDWETRVKEIRDEVKEELMKTLSEQIRKDIIEEMNKRITKGDDYKLSIDDDVFQSENNSTNKLNDQTEIITPIVRRTRRSNYSPQSTPSPNSDDTPTPVSSARIRGRREAFYHAQQPVFDAEGQCIAIGSTTQLPACSFTCKITQNGVIKIGESILPDEAIVPLNEVEVGIAQTIGKKPTMEDTCCVYETNIPFMEVIGMFDGHHGQDAAIELSKQMGIVLKKALREKKKNVCEALLSTFENLHQIVIEKTESGSTGTVVAIEQNTAYVAHVGDSPVFLIKRNSEKKIEKVTINHHPDIPEERERIEKNGGHCYKVGNTWRVEGVIALSRSLGDRALHPSLSAIPDVNSFDLTDVTEIVITSDGVTDVLNEDDIANLVFKSVNVDTAANSIRDTAFKKQSLDNITAIVVKIPH